MNYMADCKISAMLNISKYQRKGGENMKVIDELCICGHKQSEHSDALKGFVRGHGDCQVCDCSKFTWKKFIYETEEKHEKII